MSSVTDRNKKSDESKNTKDKPDTKSTKEDQKSLLNKVIEKLKKWTGRG